jgi:NADH dehydrogenase
VRVPTRKRQAHKDLLVLPGLELRNADVHDPQTLDSLVAGCDSVINLVGILNERGHDGTGFNRVHVELVEKLMAACQRAGVQRVVQVSALKANADRGPSHYLRSKGLAERVIADLAGDEIGYTIFRPSVIFGRGDTFINRFARLLKFSPILPLPRLNARFAPVYVGDVASAIVASLTDSHCLGRTFELCGPDIYSLREILALIRRELGIRRLVFRLPLPLGQIQAWIADYLIPGKPFSLDNLRSLSVASVCSTNGFAHFRIEPKRLETVAQEYLGRKPDKLARLRATAHQ